MDTHKLKSTEREVDLEQERPAKRTKVEANTSDESHAASVPAGADADDEEEEETFDQPNVASGSDLYLDTVRVSGPSQIACRTYCVIDQQNGVGF